MIVGRVILMPGLYAECFVSLAGDKRIASVASKSPVSLGFAWFYLSPVENMSFEYDAFRIFVHTLKFRLFLGDDHFFVFGQI